MAEMVSLLREALAALDPADSAVRARLTARLGAALMPPKGLEDYLHNVGLSREATAMARRLGDRHTPALRPAELLQRGWLRHAHRRARGRVRGDRRDRRGRSASAWSC